MKSGGSVAVVVGAGIVGLAHALAFARRGSRVILLERSAAAVGASIRNFGLVWPIGQPAGERLSTALRSREIWGEVCTDAGLPMVATGSLHLAHRREELDVIEEFAAVAAEGEAGGAGYSVRLLSPAEVVACSPYARAEGLLGGLYSETELTVEPRRSIARLPAYLAERFGVEVRFGTAVTSVESGAVVLADGERISADHVIVASGDDIATLFPFVVGGAGMTRCKLQMLRTVPQPSGFALGPAVAGGLTLRFYDAFRVCRSLAALQAVYRDELPDYERFGIHVMASQTPEGQVTIGDSHEYGLTPQPFDDPAIDGLVLDYLATFLRLPDPSIAERWHGIYLKHPDRPWFDDEVAPGVRVVTGLGGAGMTLSFGLAERVVDGTLAA
jgi:D-hydroxyproline dehydrogenase subunit beta